MARNEEGGRRVTTRRSSETEVDNAALAKSREDPAIAAERQRLMAAARAAGMPEQTYVDQFLALDADNKERQILGASPYTIRADGTIPIEEVYKHYLFSVAADSSLNGDVTFQEYLASPRTAWRLTPDGKSVIWDKSKQTEAPFRYDPKDHAFRDWALSMAAAMAGGAALSGLSAGVGAAAPASAAPGAAGSFGGSLATGSAEGLLGSGLSGASMTGLDAGLSSIAGSGIGSAGGIAATGSAAGLTGADLLAGAGGDFLAANSAAQGLGGAAGLGSAAGSSTFGPLASVGDMISSVAGGGSLATGAVPAVTGVSPAGVTAALGGSAGALIDGPLGAMTVDAAGNIVPALTNLANSSTSLLPSSSVLDSLLDKVPNTPPGTSNAVKALTNSGAESVADSVGKSLWDSVVDSGLLGPLVQGAGSLIGGALANDAAKDAAKAQTDAVNAAIAEQRRQYDLARADQAPFRETGVAANARLAHLLGVGPNSGASGYGDLARRFGLSDLQADPVYQTGLKFGLEQGTKGINQRAIASGSYDSGGTLKELTRYGTDYANSKANESYNRFVNDQNSIYNRLAGVSGAGQVATNQIGASGANMANNVSNLLGDQGNARAAGIVGGANAWGSALGGVNSAINNWQDNMTRQQNNQLSNNILRQLRGY